MDSEIKPQMHETVYNTTAASQQPLEQLPAIVQRWLQRSGIANMPVAEAVCLHQKGQMRTKPGGRWMPFTAAQYFNITDPGFIWTARIRMAPFVYLQGYDKLDKGVGSMKIKLLSWIKLVNQHDNYKINRGSMVRLLAEICWFPGAALQPWIQWKTVDEISAQATFTYGSVSVNGLFRFNEDGDITHFSALRFMGSGDKARLEEWDVEMLAYKEFNGIRIPYKSRVIWKLTGGDFDWLTLEITDLAYNKECYIKQQEYTAA